MAKTLSKTTTDKFDKITSIAEEVKANKLTKEELVELKSYKIVKALKLKKYVRN